MSNKSQPPVNITGLILAGGRARRMDGQDKGLLPLAGMSLIERCVARLAPQVTHILISANRNIEQYQVFGHPVLHDSVAEYQGPLAGVQRALEMTPDMPLLVVPCDAPLLSTQLAARLLGAYQQNNNTTIIPHDGTRLQPLFALFPPDVLASLNQYLGSGQRKVDTWVTSLPHMTVDFSGEADCFLNINTEDDLQGAASILEKHTS